MAEDLFDGLLELEGTFYNEGHSLGVEDGRRAGLVEGRFFGLEKGFEKYAAMGRFHGRSIVWAGRLQPSPQDPPVRNLHREEASNVTTQDQASGLLQSDLVQEPTEEACLHRVKDQGSPSTLPLLPDNPRLEKHVRTLSALVEPSSLSTANGEDSVSDFDDRFKRAEGKVRIIEKLIGEVGNHETINGAAFGGHGKGTSPKLKTQEDGIEDISILHARH